MVITITGADLCGKTTQFEIIKKKFDNRGIKYTPFSFPDYGTSIGKLMGAMLDHRVISIKGEDGDLRGDGDYLGKVKKGGSSTIFQLLAIANLHEQQKVMREAAKNGYVLCCRYSETSLAYGQIDCVGNWEWIEEAQKELISSDITILLEAQGFKRDSEILDDNESKQWFQDAVKKAYHALAIQRSWSIINSDKYKDLSQDKSIECIAKDIVKILKQHGINL